MKSISNNNNVPLLFLCFCLCLSSLPLLNAADGQNKLVTKACAKAKYKDLCISSLKAEHASQDASDLATIALVALRVASNNGSDTSVYMKKVLIEKSKLLEPGVQQAFDDCSEQYISATQQLDDALSALVSRNYKDAKVWTEAALTDATSCEAGLKEDPGNELELVSKNTVFLQLCTNALDILNLLAST